MTTIEQRKAILDEMEAALGRPPTPDDVINIATDPQHVLHGDFEWNDGLAGHHWRQMQARSLLRSVEIVVIRQGRAVHSVEYVRNPSLGRQQGYVNVTTVTKRSAEAREILHMLVRRVRSHVETAREVAAVLELEDELQLLLEQIVAFEGKIFAKGQRKPQKARS